MTPSAVPEEKVELPKWARRHTHPNGRKMVEVLRHTVKKWHKYNGVPVIEESESVNQTAMGQVTTHIKWKNVRVNERLDEGRFQR